MSPDVVVCGAGAGGLAAANALSARGFDVLVVDKQTRRHPVAKGEVLQPGALRVLRAWGVERELTDRGALRLSHLVVRDPHGTPLMSLDYDKLPGEDRSLLVHEHGVILACLAEAIGKTVRVQHGTPVQGLLRDDSGRVTGVRAAGTDLRAPLVIAADGVGSRLRRDAGIEAERTPYPHRLASFELSATPEVADFSAYLTASGLRLVYPLPSGRTRMYVQVTPDELRGTDGPSMARWCDRVLAETPALAALAEPLRRALHTRQLLPVARLLSPRLSVAGLAFVGESAFAVHPMAAQGMNVAITAAESLAGHLERAGRLTAEAVDRALRDFHDEQAPSLAHTARTSASAALMVTDLSWRGRVLGRRAVRHTGANPRLCRVVTRNLAGIQPQRLSTLDRLHQLGILPDPRAHRVA